MSSATWPVESAVIGALQIDVWNTVAFGDRTGGFRQRGMAVNTVVDEGQTRGGGIGFGA